MPPSVASPASSGNRAAMSVANTYDLAIVGAGCAGLSLAAEIAATGTSKTVAVLDQRTEWPDDRTWSFWDLEDTFGAFASGSWERFSVGAPGMGSHVLESPWPYRSISSERWYGHCLERIGHTPQLHLLAGTAVGSVVRQGEGFSISTSQGAIPAREVVDTRPPAVKDDWMKQHFLGWRVRTEKPVFDTRAATLMDFRESPDGVWFFYVLPFSATEALVETTWFSLEVAPQAQYESELRQELARLGIDTYETTHTERGVLPMALITPPGNGVVSAGIASGAMRASTGYCFLPVQRQVAAMAKAFAAGTPLSTHVQRSVPLQGLDRIFLRFLADCPESAPRVLTRLFLGAGPAATIRFLSDVPTFADYASVILRMPKVDMLRALGRMVRHDTRLALMGGQE